MIKSYYFLRTNKGIHTPRTEKLQENTTIEMNKL